MTLTATDFEPILTALTTNAPVIVGLIVGIAAVNMIFRIVKRHARV